MAIRYKHLLRYYLSQDYVGDIVQMLGHSFFFPTYVQLNEELDIVLL